MPLNSAIFVAFLCAVCVVAYLMPRKIRYIWLLLCSYAFYLYDPLCLFGRHLPALLLMIGATLVSYSCALFMYATERKWLQRIFLCLSLFSCIGVLLVSKYTAFFAGPNSPMEQTLTRLNLLMPLGISYYILQTVGYAVDVYTKAIKPEINPLRYALFVSFFPGLVTGPINRATAMLPQYTTPAKFNYNRIAGGLFRVLWGLFKKMVIADNLGLYTAAIFGDPGKYTGPELVLAILVFAYQLYTDFGGCCDIAIGAARMLGFDFMENFNRPFAAKNFQALWQRWHISLTSFFRDYVFTPLVWSRWTEKLPIIGKKISKPPAVSSVIIIFALSGLWHGPHINYVVWGLLNGGIMAIATLFSKRWDKMVRKIPVYGSTPIRGFCQRIIVYLMFSGCLVFFASAMFGFPVGAWLAGLTQGWRGAFVHGTLVTNLLATGLNTNLLLALGGGILLVEIVEQFGNVADWIRRRLWVWRWPLYYLLLAGLLFFGAFGQSPFIYQQY